MWVSMWQIVFIPLGYKRILVYNVYVYTFRLSWDGTDTMYFLAKSTLFFIKSDLLSTFETNILIWTGTCIHVYIKIQIDQKCMNNPY